MANQAFEDAAKAFTHAPDFAKSLKLLFLRSECYMNLNDLMAWF